MVDYLLAARDLKVGLIWVNRGMKRHSLQITADASTIKGQSAKNAKSYADGLI